MAQSINLIYVTHSLDSILPNTNRVILFKNGSIINDGTKDNIINSAIISDLYDTPINVIKHKKYWGAFPLSN